MIPNPFFHAVSGFLAASLLVLSARPIIATKTHMSKQLFSSPTPTPPPIPTPTPTPEPTHTPTPKPTPKPTSTPTPTPSPKPTSVPLTSGQLDSWFNQYSNHYSIDRSLLYKIAVCESGLRPNAINGIYGGMFQFSGSTWKTTRSAMNMDTNTDLRFNAEESIRTAAFKISVSGAGAWPNCSK